MRLVQEFQIELYQLILKVTKVNLDLKEKLEKKEIKVNLEKRVWMVLFIERQWRTLLQKLLTLL